MGLASHAALEIFRSAQHAACEERSFVLQALRIPHQVRADADDWILEVEARDAARAQAELVAWERENAVRRRPPVVDPRTPRSRGLLGALVYAGTLTAVLLAQNDQRVPVNVTRAGRNVGELIRGGEVWRTVTSLTLHVDAAHFLGNLFFGLLFGVLLSRAVGAGVGWLATLLAGMAGNLVNVYVQGPDYRSLGASTAVFGTIGILTAYRWRQLAWSDRWWLRLAPPIVGAILLGFLGGSGEHTDVLAHVLGMAAGGVLGVAIAALEPRGLLRPAAQLVCGCSAIAILLAAWTTALARAR
jgi:membrane associated rhomboid family serine protease